MALSLQLISQLFWACNDCIEYKLVLHNAIFLVTCLATLEKKIIASCRSHVARCNLGLHFAMVSKQSMQSLQKVNRVLLCAIIASPQILRDKLQRGHARCILSRNAIVTQVSKKIAPCNTSSTFCNYCRDFFKHCELHLETETYFLFSTLQVTA